MLLPSDERQCRAPWIVCLAVIIPLGILSRMGRTGYLLFDKYLGDLLYAAMIYCILRLWWASRVAAVLGLILMTAIELFQLTLIAAEMLKSEHLIVRIVARLMGTHFSYLDWSAYVVAIGMMYLAESSAPQSN